MSEATRAVLVLAFCPVICRKGEGVEGRNRRHSRYDGCETMAIQMEVCLYKCGDGCKLCCKLLASFSFFSAFEIVCDTSHTVKKYAYILCLFEILIQTCAF